MGVHYDASRQKYVVRWQADGRRRSRRFETKAEAIAFAGSVPSRAPGRPPLLEPDLDPPPAPIVQRSRRGDGVYSYPTGDGPRWRFVFRQSDGTLSSRRGFASRRAAATARRRLLESIERGEVKVARERFGAFWTRLLAERRPYLTAGSFVDFETHGRKRLLPAFADVSLARMDEDRVRDWLGAMARCVEAGEISPKTVNNARTCLSVALNEACRRGLIARNPCAAVPALPIDRVELDYLRLDEVEPYLDACMSHYCPLAQFLIGTGTRVSEAVAIQFQHLALDEGVVRVYRQRGRDGDHLRPTKAKRFRSVQIGPALMEALGQLQPGRVPTDWVFVCPGASGFLPKRTRLEDLLAAIHTVAAGGLSGLPPRSPAA
jgi:integrase